MSSKTHKFTQTLTRKDAGSFLIKLAKAVETEHLDLQGHKLEWSQVNKIKCTFYSLENRIILRTKLEYKAKEPASGNLKQTRKDFGQGLKQTKKRFKFQGLAFQKRIKRALWRGASKNIPARQDEIKDKEGAWEHGSRETVSAAGYKELKKRMKKTFASISRSIVNQQLPRTRDMESFMQDSISLVSISGYGDDYYQAFNESVQRMYEACQQQDHYSLHQSFHEVKRIQRDCHNRYK